MNPTEPAGVESEMVAARGDFGRAAAQAREQIAALLFAVAPAEVVVADRYVLGPRLGTGGQGTVWCATDRQLAREVAIKVVHLADRGDDATANLWLRREAQMLGRLAHPSVVAVFDLGLCPASVFGGPADDRTVMFIVMELVGGVPLDAWLRARVRTVDEILDVMEQIARGLQAVHASQLVHCDVKPSNILVDGAIAKLADFGLAHATRSIAAVLEDTSSTRWRPATDMSMFGSTARADMATIRSQGPIGGTPRYMAPEQMSGAPLDARADEFAFAATLFEALYDRAPHEGSAVNALRRAKLRGAPIQPDSRLGTRAYAALARSMAANPADRHGDVGKAMAAIKAGQRVARRQSRAWLAGLGTIGVLGFAVPGSIPCATERAWQLSDADAQAVIASVAQAGTDADRRIAERVLAGMREQERHASEAWASACVAPTRVVTSCLDRVDAGARAAMTALREVDGRQSYRALTIVEGLADPRACLQGKADPLVVGPALDPDDTQATAAWAALSRARAKARAGDSRAALDILDDLPEGDAGPLSAEIELARAELLDGLARHEESRAVLTAVYERADAAGDSLDAARAAVGLAFAIGVDEQRFDEGLAWVRHGETHLQRALVPSRVGADLANAKGAIYFRRGQYAEARAELESALGQAEGGPVQRVRRIRENLAILKFIDGDPDALDYMAASYELMVEALGEEHPSTIASLANLGNAQVRSGELPEARKNLERALAMLEATVGPDAYYNARLLSMLAELDRIEGDPESAIAHLRRAAVLRERALPADHPERANETVELAELMIDTGDLDAAEHLLDRHVDHFAATFGSDHPAFVAFTHARGEIALRRGRHAEAARLIGSAVRGATALGNDGDQLPIWVVEAAQAEAAIGRFAEAREYVEMVSPRYAELPPTVQAQLDRVRDGLPR